MGLNLRLKEKWQYLKETSISLLQDIVLKQIDNKYIAFNNLLNIYGEDKEEKCLYLKPYNTKPLYAVRISSYGNIAKPFNQFGHLARNHNFKDAAKAIVVYSKRDMLVDEAFDDFATKQDVYVFTSLKEIAEEFAYFYDTDLMDTGEMLHALFDIGFINEYHNNKDDFSVVSGFDIGGLHLDDLFYGFKTIFSEGLYKAISKDNRSIKPNYTLYQGLGTNTALSAGKPDFRRIMRLPWKGYIAFTFDFSENRVKGHIREIRKETKAFDKNKKIRHAYKTLDEEIRSTDDPSKYCVMNVVALIDNPKIKDRLSAELNISFIEKHRKRKEIIYGTPLSFRDSMYDGLATIEQCGQYIRSIHKRHNMPSQKSRDIYGVDIYGNYTAYSFSETGESPHWAMVAPTRSGKTFTIMEMVIQSIGAKIVPKTPREMGDMFAQEAKSELDRIYPEDKIEYCTKLGKVKIVQFDIGFSAIKFIKELKKAYPQEVILFEDDLNNLRFGVTDIRYDYENKRLNVEDVNFSIFTMSLILEVNGESMITAAEQNEITEALERIYSEDTYTGRDLKYLEEIGGYEEVLAKIKSMLGEKYDPYLKTTEMNLRGTELDFLQKPLIKDIMKELNNKMQSLMVKQTERDSCASAYNKLKIIDGNIIFSLYPKSSIKDSSYFYMELQTIKTLGDQIFIPVFLSIFQRLYRRDVLRAQEYKGRNEVPPKIIYIIEEAHNFIGQQNGYESLRKVFDVILREAARFNIHFGFITQGTRDIGEDLLGNIRTRIVMPSEGVTGEELKEYYWKSDTGREGDFYSLNAEKYYAFINYGKNVLAIKTPVTKSEERILNSNPTQIQKLLEEVAGEKEDDL